MVQSNRVFLMKHNALRTPLVKGNGMMPLRVQRQTLADRVGVVGKGGAVVLIDETLPKQNEVLGTGFGVKTMDKSVIKKLENLNIGKKRKNVNFQV